jgi:hypothetical protein
MSTYAPWDLLTRLPSPWSCITLDACWFRLATVAGIRCLLCCLVRLICRNSGAFPDDICVSIGAKYQLVVECLERMLIGVSDYGWSQASFSPTEHM